MKIIKFVIWAIGIAFVVWFTVTAYVDAGDQKVTDKVTAEITETTSAINANVAEVKEMVLAANKRIEEGTLSDAIWNTRRELRDWKKLLAADPGNQAYKDVIQKCEDDIKDLVKRRDNLRISY